MKCSTSDALWGVSRLYLRAKRRDVPYSSGTFLRQTAGAPGSRSGFRRRYRCLQTERTSVRVGGSKTQGGREVRHQCDCSELRAVRELNDVCNCQCVQSAAMAAAPVEQRRIKGASLFHLDARLPCRPQRQSARTARAALRRVAPPSDTSAQSSEGDGGRKRGHSPSMLRVFCLTS